MTVHPASVNDIGDAILFAVVCGVFAVGVPALARLLFPVKTKRPESDDADFS